MKEDIQEKSLSSLCSYSLCHQPTTSPLNHHAPKAPKGGKENLCHSPSHQTRVSPRLFSASSSKTPTPKPASRRAEAKVMRALTPNGYFCAAAAFARLSLAPLFSVEPPSCVCVQELAKRTRRVRKVVEEEKSPPPLRLFCAFFGRCHLKISEEGRRRRAASSTRYPVNSLEKGGNRREGGEPKLGRSDNPPAIFQAGAACASTRFHPARRESRSPSRIIKAIGLSTRGESPNI